MAATALPLRRTARAAVRATSEPFAVKLALISVAVGFLGLFLVVPLVAVFAQALEKGWAAYAAALVEPMALSALKLTLLTAAVAVPLNLVFGVAAAWAIAKFEFPGKNAADHADRPAVRASRPSSRAWSSSCSSGGRACSGPGLQAHDLKIVFAVPGLILATVFVTFPFVARELIPLMQAEGTEEEEAARVLGASGWQMFWRVTLPNIKWGLLYGVILCNARAMGEFGAVSVVSGPHPRQDQHAAAARRDPLQRIRLPGGLRGRLAPGLPGAGHPGRQDGGRVASAQSRASRRTEDPSMSH